MFLESDDAEDIRILHARAVKAAQQMTAATPGTETYKRKARAYEQSEIAFSRLVRALEGLR